MIIEAGKRPIRRSHGSPESRLQVECFTWAWNTYPETRKRLFHVVNEQDQNDIKKTMQLVSMGLIAGVSDLVMLIARGKYHGWLCEMKTETGRQRPQQKEWQEIMESEGFKYVICRSLDDFKRELTEYLNG